MMTLILNSIASANTANDQVETEVHRSNETVKQNESLLKLSDSLDITFAPQDQNRFPNDKDKQARYNQWVKNLSRDIYLDQAVKVMKDMIVQRNMALGKHPEEVKKTF